MGRDLSAKIKLSIKKEVEEHLNHAHDGIEVILYVLYDDLEEISSQSILAKATARIEKARALLVPLTD